MKRCTYCGKEYPDEAAVCAIDGQPLEPITAATVAPPIAQYYGVRKQLTFVAPLRAGIVLAVLYACLGLIFIPFFLLGAILGNKAGAPGAFGGVFLAVLFPILYAIGGFLAGVVGAALYNLVAKWTGGLQFEVRDAPSRGF